MKQHCAILALLLLSLPFFQNSEAAIKCTDVLKDLIPCVAYLVTNSGSPSTACCKGVTALSSNASTTADQRAACNCIMSVVSKVKPNTSAAQALPGSCNVTLPFTVSPSLDCSKINSSLTPVSSCGGALICA